MPISCSNSTLVFFAIVPPFFAESLHFSRPIESFDTVISVVAFSPIPKKRSFWGPENTLFSWAWSKSIPSHSCDPLNFDLVFADF